MWLEGGGGGTGQNLLVIFQGNLPPDVGTQASKSNNDKKCSIANNAFLLFSYIFCAYSGIPPVGLILN